MAFRAAVIGASGYTGGDLLRLLAGHPELEAVHLTASSNAGELVERLHPALAPVYAGQRFVAYDPGDLDGLDVAFLALPHGESQTHLEEIQSRVGCVVDLGADFRLEARIYERWYGEEHRAPALLESFAYGLPELFREEIRAARLVANPGCYPTAAALALAPLVADGLVEPKGIVVNALSGISGRGRGLAAPSLFSEANETVTPYGLLTHRHTPEIEAAIGRAATMGSGVEVLFTPHLVPMTRGVLTTCTARPTGVGLSTARLLESYRQHYAGEEFVTVSESPPATKAAWGSNSAHLTARYDERTGTVLAICAIDNLVKGASGQAVQNANLVLGLPEGSGLSAIGVAP
ncbi:MAG: N-acetyl-gamma-glutamyl-phosphate reductase [Acidimicrobiia bacterium]